MGAVEIDIVIPSHLRADRVITLGAIDHAKICVPESQEEEYRKHNPEAEIVTHPDSVKGLTPKRQWIIERFPNVFMIDDDIEAVTRLYTEKGERAKLMPHEAYDVVQYIGNCAKMAGCFLFGMNKNPNPAQYMEMRPINLTATINGIIGILEGGGLFFHPKAVVSEDYWISGFNAFKNRKAWIDTRFSYMAKDTFKNKGGCSAYRTEEQEKEDTIWLREMFGECLEVKKDTKLAKRKHKWQRTLKIPL